MVTVGTTMRRVRGLILGVPGSAARTSAPFVLAPFVFAAATYATAFICAANSGSPSWYLATLCSVDITSPSDL